MKQCSTKELTDELIKRSDIKTLSLPEEQFIEVIVEGKEIDRIEGPAIILISKD